MLRWSRQVSWVLVLWTIAVSACAGQAPRTGASVPAPAGQASEPEQPAEHTTLKVAYVPVLAFAPLYRGVAKGYFSAAGIDVDLTVVQSASDVVAFLGTGQIDVAMGNVGAPLFNAVNRGLNVKVVGGNSYNQKDPATLVAAPLLLRKQLADDGVVKTLADLKGHPVAINAPAGIQEYSLSRLLGASQLTLSDVDVQLIAFPDMMAGLSSGALDAAMLPEPFSANAREKGIATVLVPNPAPGATVTAILYGENLLKPEQERVAKAFLEALRKAANELQTEKDIFSDENLAIWSEYTKVPAEAIKGGAPYAYSQNLALDVASLLDQQQFMIRAGRVDFKDPLPEERLVDSRFVVRS